MWLGIGQALPVKVHMGFFTSMAIFSLISHPSHTLWDCTNPVRHSASCTYDLPCPPLKTCPMFCSIKEVSDLLTRDGNSNGTQMVVAGCGNGHVSGNCSQKLHVPASTKSAWDFWFSFRTVHSSD